MTEKNKLVPVAWITPEGEGWRMRFDPPVTDVPLGWTELYEKPVELIKQRDDLLAELQNIANADPRKWDEETRDQFQQWAQSRARAAIAKATGESK